MGYFLTGKLGRAWVGGGGAWVVDVGGGRIGELGPDRWGSLGVVLTLL